MPRLASLLTLLCLTAPLAAIPAHRESLQEVVRGARWVCVVTVLKVEPLGGDNGSGLRLEVQIDRTIYGEAPASPAHLIYWEAWPAQDPHGKVEAPIWTGSSLERELSVGDQCIAISRHGSGLSRAEPLEAEEEIRRLLEAD